MKISVTPSKITNITSNSQEEKYTVIDLSGFISKKKVNVLLDYISQNSFIVLLQEEREFKPLLLQVMHLESEQGRNLAFYFHIICFSRSLLNFGFF